MPIYVCSHDANIGHQHKKLPIFTKTKNKESRVQNWFFPMNSTCEELESGTKYQALPNFLVPLLFSYFSSNFSSAFNLNNLVVSVQYPTKSIMYFQRKSSHSFLSCVLWLHRNPRLCSVSLQQHQKACNGYLLRNARLPNFKDLLASLQPSKLSSCTSTFWVTSFLAFKHILIWTRTGELQKSNAQQQWGLAKLPLLLKALGIWKCLYRYEKSVTGILHKWPRREWSLHIPCVAIISRKDPQLIAVHCCTVSWSRNW